MAALKFCPFCGFKLAGGEEFCPNCGKILPVEAEKVTPVLQEKESLTPLQMSSTENLGSKKKVSWPAILVGIIILLGLGGATILYFTRSPKTPEFSGTYSATIPLVYHDAIDTMKFADGKVTETFENQTTKGTYKISGQKLIVTLGKAKLTAQFSQDKKIFTLVSADSDLGLTVGLKYSKGAKKIVDDVAIALDAKTEQTIKRPVKGSFSVKEHRVIIATGRHLVNVDLGTDKSFEIAQTDLESWVGAPKVEQQDATADSESTASATAESATKKSTTESSTVNSTTASTTEQSSPAIADKKVKGTYEVAGDLFTITIGRYKAVIKISTDKKTFELVSLVIAPEKVEMNFDEIMTGNYVSLMGKWKMVANGAMDRRTGKMQWRQVQDDMVVTPDKIQTNSIWIVGGKYSDDRGNTVAANFTQENNLLYQFQSEGGLYWSTVFQPGKPDAAKEPLEGSNITLDPTKNTISFAGRNGGAEIIYEQVSQD